MLKREGKTRGKKFQALFFVLYKARCKDVEFCDDAEHKHD